MLCLWTQKSVGQTGFDRRHHRWKNNKIRTPPSLSLPPRLPQPADHELSLLYPVLMVYFSSLSLLYTIPYLSTFATLFISTSNFPPHKVLLQLTRCLLCSHRHLLNQFVFISSCPLFTQHLSGAYWLCNIFNHVTVNMSEVLCTCWGSIQHSLSQRDHTDPLCRGGVVKFLSGASRICCCCHSSKPQAFHFVSMWISYLRDNTKQIFDIIHTQLAMN